jgi:hypothetical protein
MEEESLESDHYFSISEEETPLMRPKRACSNVIFEFPHADFRRLVFEEIRALKS